MLETSLVRLLVIYALRLLNASDGYQVVRDSDEIWISSYSRSWEVETVKHRCFEALEETGGFDTAVFATVSSNGIATSALGTFTGFDARPPPRAYEKDSNLGDRVPALFIVAGPIESARVSDVTTACSRYWQSCARIHSTSDSGFPTIFSVPTPSTPADTNPNWLSTISSPIKQVEQPPFARRCWG